MTSVLAILGLGLLIVVHEVGHMFIARRCGMRVDRFSVGFGPPLVRWRGKETTYQLGLIPLGGFVQIAGMNPHENLPPDDPGSYVSKPASARFATILAGPLTNYLFSIFLMLFVMLAWGLPQWQHVVADVAQGSPAARSGMIAGDVIEKINGKTISGMAEVTERISRSEGKPMRLTVRRASGILELVVTPRAEGKTYRIGIQLGHKLAFTPLSLRNALVLGAAYPLRESRNVLAGLARLFSGKASMKQVGGPLEIVRQLKMSFEQSLAMALLFLAMLNVYLGLFNLLPIPALDGGRLLFLMYTILFRRPVNQRVETAIHTMGFILLLGLIALVTCRDIGRLLGVN